MNKHGYRFDRYIDLWIHDSLFKKIIMNNNMPYLQSEKDIMHNFRIIEKPGFNIINSI